MDAFFASPELQICRSFREACFGAGSTILRGMTGPDPVQEFARAAAQGLGSQPRTLESRFLYDSQGSALFELITKQPEYYLTRTETAILAGNSSRIREMTGPVMLVELGSGSSHKIDHLLRAWLERSPSVCYVPVDVSESALVGASRKITSKYRTVKVIGVNCDFQQALPLVSQLSPVMVMLLGSTIGNFAPARMSGFLQAMACSLASGDFLLLGLDLVKPRPVLEAAYNDAAGVSAEFTRNVFARMNRELGCAIDLKAIEHLARYDEAKEQIEIFARFTRRQTLSLAPLGMELTIGPGELVQTEISRKFRLELFVPYLERFGFVAEELFVDERQWFALVLLRRTAKYRRAARRGQE
jgi:L-histidine N-alpha-methyltransferase